MSKITAIMRYLWIGSELSNPARFDNSILSAKLGSLAFCAYLCKNFPIFFAILLEQITRQNEKF
jgi:hypothetical protein